jgi:hypothetical protein
VRSLREILTVSLPLNNMKVQYSDEVVTTSRCVPFEVKVGENGVSHETYSQETSRCPHISGRDCHEGFIELLEMAPLGHAVCRCHLVALAAAKSTCSFGCKPRGDSYYVLLRSLRHKLSQPALLLLHHLFIYCAECAPQLAGGPGGRTRVRFRSSGFEVS